VRADVAHRALRVVVRARADVALLVLDAELDRVQAGNAQLLLHLAR
jgi:hypothetical protein